MANNPPQDDLISNVLSVKSALIGELVTATSQHLVFSLTFLGSALLIFVSYGTLPISRSVVVPGLTIRDSAFIPAEAFLVAASFYMFCKFIVWSDLQTGIRRATVIGVSTQTLHDEVYSAAQTLIGREHPCRRRTIYRLQEGIGSRYAFLFLTVIILALLCTGFLLITMGILDP